MRANNARKGIFCINGRKIILKKDYPFYWNLDPLTLKYWPVENVFRKIKFSAGDLRFCWELGRMHHIIWYGQAWKLTKEIEWTKLIIKELEELINISKFEYGIHWRDGLQLSIRIFSMIGSADICNEAPIEFHEKITPIIKLHAFALSRQISPDSEITNNHIIGELSALALAGIYLNSPDYYYYSIKKLEKELNRQIYSDGVPYEGSIPYIKFILEFLLLLQKAALKSQFKSSSILNSYIKKISLALSKLVTKNGYVPPIGDGDDGRVIRFDDEEYLNTNEILNAASIFLNIPLAPKNKEFLFCKFLFGKKFSPTKKLDHFNYLNKSGLAHFNYKDFDLWIDCGPTGLGFNGPGGHGHNDTTAIVFHYKDRPILHDPGWFGYFIDEDERNYFRSTFSHNTINIDNQEQARLASKFEILNDCHPTKTKIFRRKNLLIITCGHDGYSRLRKGILYSRKIKISFDGVFEMEVSDMIESNESLKVCSHLGSNYQWKKKQNNIYQLSDNFLLDLDENAQNIEIIKKRWSLQNNVLNYGSAINWQISEKNLNNKFAYFSKFKFFFLE